jgi:hypothetical protein
MESNPPMLKAALFVLAVMLGGCTTDEEDAARVCGGITNSDIRDICVANYLSYAQARTNAEWDMIGASMLNRPVQTSCMNIGGIVTCTSR